MRIFNFLCCTAGLLIGLLTTPTYAQKGKNISRVLTKQANNASFTQALQHAQAVTKIRLSTLEAAITAAQAKALSQANSLVTATTKESLALKSAQQRLKDLEEFIQTYQYFPKQRFGQSVRESSIRQWADRFVRQSSLKDPIAQRIIQLRKQYLTATSKKNGKSPQQWLTELEAFIQQNGHYPRSTPRHSPEGSLYFGVSSVLSRLEVDDPIVLRIRQLRKEYPVELAVNRGKRPQQWLNELETFIQENGRYPSSRKDIPQEYSLYGGIRSVLYFLEVDDPIAVRMRQIREQYGIHTHPHIF